MCYTSLSRRSRSRSEGNARDGGLPRTLPYHVPHPSSSDQPYIHTYMHARKHAIKHIDAHHAFTPTPAHHGSTGGSKEETRSASIKYNATQAFGSSGDRAWGSYVRLCVCVSVCALLFSCLSSSRYSVSVAGMLSRRNTPTCTHVFDSWIRYSLAKVIVFFLMASVSV